MNPTARIASIVLLGLLLPSLHGGDPIVATQASPTKIIDYGGGGWKDGQVNEPCILVNPKDPKRLIMFYSGMKLGGSAGAVGKAWAELAEPFVWHEDDKNPLLTRD